MTVSRIVVDATQPSARAALWGMTLVERALRQLHRAGARAAQVRLPPGVDLGELLRRDFPGGPGGIVATGIAAGDGLVRDPDSAALTLWLDAAAVYDTRVIELLVAAQGPTQLYRVAHAWVDGPAAAAPPGQAGPTGPAGQPEIIWIDLARLPSYLPNLRRHRAPFVLPIRDRADLAAAERITFEAVYKGVTDVITKYVYPRIVAFLVRILAPTPITPNQVTAVSMVLSFGAIPAFATGHLGLGIAMGLVMSVLDSVDGKLARLTFRESRRGSWMDHGSDFVYFGVWLVAVAAVAGVGAARWVMPAAWLLDKGVTGLFQRVRGRELNDWAPIDAAFRLIVIRRNVFLVVLAAGVVAGRPDLAISALAAWAVIGLAFHAARALWIAVTGEPPRASRLHGETP